MISEIVRRASCDFARGRYREALRYAELFFFLLKCRRVRRRVVVRMILLRIECLRKLCHPDDDERVMAVVYEHLLWLLEKKQDDAAAALLLQAARWKMTRKEYWAAQELVEQALILERSLQIRFEAFLQMACLCGKRRDPMGSAWIETAADLLDNHPEELDLRVNRLLLGIETACVRGGELDAREAYLTQCDLLEEALQLNQKNLVAHTLRGAGCALGWLNPKYRETSEGLKVVADNLWENRLFVSVGIDGPFEVLKRKPPADIARVAQELLHLLEKPDALLEFLRRLAD